MQRDLVQALIQAHGSGKNFKIASCKDCQTWHVHSVFEFSKQQELKMKYWGLYTFGVCVICARYVILHIKKNQNGIEGSRRNVDFQE